MPTLPQLSVVDAKGAIDRREVSCLEYVQALVDQHAKTESLNGFVFFDRDALLQAAREHDESLTARTGRLPLSGIPLAIKDNIDCAGMPTAAGTAALRDAVPRADAPVVARVIDAGALAAGKANMHELAFGCTNDNGFFGPARNAYDPSRIPGGSSGGSAVLVASGAVPAALGTDTGGSVRIPAALCGLVGFRPTHGRYPSGGVVPISPTRDTVGPIARTVADVMLLDEILSGNGTALPAVDDTRGFRLAVPYSTLWEGLSPDARPVLERALHASAAVSVGGLVPASVRNRIGGLVSCIGRFVASRVRGRRSRRSIVMTAGTFRPQRRRQQAPRGWRIPSCP